jgi:hypothetical protein
VKKDQGMMQFLSPDFGINTPKEEVAHGSRRIPGAFANSSTDRDGPRDTMIGACAKSSTSTSPRRLNRR